MLTLFAPALRSAAAPVRIVPIGDSITHGDGAPSYRYRLWRKLLDAGVEFDFVGTLNNNDNLPTYPPQTFDGDHQGHTSYGSAQLASVVSSLGSATPPPYTPDIALVHVGTNDWGETPSFTYSRLAELVLNLQAWNPQVTVLLARLIPHYSFLDNGYHNARINSINALIDANAAALSTPTSRVIVVDQNTGFIANPSGVDTTDGVHPSPSGEEKMAQRWLDALLPLVGNPTLTAVTIASSNVSPALAKTGDAITLSFTADKEIHPPTVTIAGRAAAVANPGGNHWTATITVAAGDAQGAAAFTIDFSDLANHSGTTVAATTDSSAVTVDTLSPVVSAVGGPAYFTTSDTITLAGSATDAVLLSQVTWTNDRGGSGAAVGTGNWSIQALPLQPGVNGITVTALDATGNSGAIALTVTRQTIYEAWAAQYGLAGTDALLETDFDSDGLANLLEFAYGLNPTVVYSGMIVVTDGVITGYGVPRISVTNTPTSVDLRVIYGRRKDRAITGLTYTVQFSATLGSWVSSAATPTVLADDGTIEAVSVPYPFFVNGRKARFFRLVVTGP